MSSPLEPLYWSANWDARPLLTHTTLPSCFVAVGKHPFPFSLNTLRVVLVSARKADGKRPRGTINTGCGATKRRENTNAINHTVRSAPERRNERKRTTLLFKEAC